MLHINNCFLNWALILLRRNTEELQNCKSVVNKKKGELIFLTAFDCLEKKPRKVISAGS